MGIRYPFSDTAKDGIGAMLTVSKNNIASA
jgi:hypothetical protein